MAVKTGEPGPPSAKEGEPSSLAALLLRASKDPAQRTFWLGAIVCTGLFIRLFWDNLGHFYYVWTTDENYSHGFLVPLISIYFANQVASREPLPIRGGLWLGSLL